MKSSNISFSDYFSSKESFEKSEENKHFDETLKENFCLSSDFKGSLAKMPQNPGFDSSRSLKIGKEASPGFLKYIQPTTIVKDKKIRTIRVFLKELSSNNIFNDSFINSKLSKIKETQGENSEKIMQIYTQTC
jgi:hypothetical protein